MCTVILAKPVGSRIRKRCLSREPPRYCNTSETDWQMVLIKWDLPILPDPLKVNRKFAEGLPLLNSFVLRSLWPMNQKSQKRVSANHYDIECWHYKFIFSYREYYCGIDTSVVMSFSVDWSKDPLKQKFCIASFSICQVASLLFIWSFDSSLLLCLTVLKQFFMNSINKWFYQNSIGIYYFNHTRRSNFAAITTWYTNILIRFISKRIKK